MKSTFPKAKPKVIKYRDFSKYKKHSFKSDLKRKMEGQELYYDNFEKLFLKTLDAHAPQKTKVVRANHKPYVTKKMRKAIMLRSHLQNKVFRHCTEEYKIALKRQKNYCNRLYKRERKQFYYNLRINDITDNKKFWKTVKPLFGDKGGPRDNIVLVEGNKIISDDVEVAQTFNDFFDNAVGNLGISENKLLLNGIENPIEAGVLDAIKMYESHPSIIKIKEHVVVAGNTLHE